MFFEEAMSEFTYSCPVCGQHIKCDMSQSGSKMECPTCFQTILAPDVSPMHDPKFVIQGTKVGDRPVPGVATASGMPAPRAPVKRSPVTAVVAVMVLIFAAGAAVFLFSGNIFKSGGGQASRTAPPAVPEAASAKNQNQVPVKPQTPAPPTVVAPAADDANWMLNLGAVTVPDAMAAGRIHGQNFLCERATFQSGVLTLRAGTRGTVDWGVTINFGGAQAENLAGKSVNITTNAPEAAKLTLRWKDGDQAGKDNFNDSYAMRIEFGPLNGNRLPGKIYLCTPDGQKSYIAGTFDAEVRKPKPPKHQ